MATVERFMSWLFMLTLIESEIWTRVVEAKGWKLAAAAAVSMLVVVGSECFKALLIGKKMINKYVVVMVERRPHKTEIGKA